MITKKTIINRLFQFILVLVGVFIFLYCFTIYMATTKYSERISNNYIENKYIKITDYYDQEGYPTFTEFANGNQSLVNMKSMYNDLVNNEVFEYLEIGLQPIELIGQFSDNIDFVLDENYDLINQELSIEDENLFITPLKAFQIGKKANEFLKLSDYIYSGNFFEENSYNYSKTNVIPIILGNSYLNSYNLGEQISGLFLGKKFTFQVIGFLHDNVTVPVNYNIYNLDNYIILPFFNYSETPENITEDIFQKKLYSIKTEAYIRYNNNDHYTKSIDELHRLAIKHNLSYTYIPNDIQDFTENNAEQVIMYSRGILLTSIFILFIIAIILTTTIIKYIDNNAKYYAIHLISGAKLLDIKRKIYYSLGVEFIIAILLSVYSLYNLLKKTVYLIYFIQYSWISCIIIFFILVFIIVLINIYIDKINLQLAIRRND